MSEIKFTIDGQPCVAKPGQTIVEAANDNGVWIPVLCRYEGLKPAGSCRICTVRVAGRYMAACTQPVQEGMAVENAAPDLEDMRKALVEMLFVEGNHFCPSCEKSGNCELQALGYRYRLTVPRFPYLWPGRALDAAALRGGGPQGHGRLPRRGHPEEGDRLRRADRQAQVRSRPDRRRRRKGRGEVGP